VRQPLMQAYESYFIQLRLRCEECGSPSSFGALRSETACLQCGALRRTDIEFWHHFIEPSMLASMMGFPPGKLDEATYLFSNGKLRYGKDGPRCPDEECQRPVPAERLHDEVLRRGELACDGCGKPLGVRPADELVRGFLPGARWVLGESVSVQCNRSAPTVQALRCSGCGAALSPAPDASILMCGYCSAVNVLPDHGTRRAKRSRGFYVLASIDTGARHALLRMSDEGKVLLAADPELPDELARELAPHPDFEVRRALAANPRTSAEVLERLATDRASEVKACVVGNPNTPQHVLVALCNEPSESVRRALARSPAASEEMLRALSKDAPGTVAEALLHRPELPDSVALALTSHGAERVRSQLARDTRIGVAGLKRLAWDEVGDIANVARWRLADLGQSGAARVGFWGSWLGRVLLRLFSRRSA
jgi:hypothetical protein